MKRLLMLISVLLIIILPGCTDSQAADKDNRLSIVTTCFPPYDFARAVTGGDADIKMLLCPGAEAHSYEPTPLDIADIQLCDVFIYIGGEGEVWADRLLESMDTSHMTIIRLIDFVDPLPEEDIAGASPDGHHHHNGHEYENEHEHEGQDYDEHIWTSLKNAEKCVRGIYDALGNPEYIKNTDEYISELDRLDSEFKEMTENAPDNIIIVGDRFPFRYLADDYDLEYFAAFSGCSSESEPGVHTMAFLIDELLEHDIDTVFYLEFSTKRIADKLCIATGAQMLPLQSCHNVSAEDFDNGVTYLELMHQNYLNLKEALY